MTQLYKWMLPYRRTSYQNVKWPVEVDEWTHAEAPVLCRSGWHGVEERHVLNHLPSLVGATLWVVETQGVIVHGDDKFAAAQMKLVRPIGTTTERNLRLFAADCAQDVLPLFEAKYPHDMRPRDAIAVARRYAVGSATKAELAAARVVPAAGDAARDAAWAAWAAAAGAAARAAWDAAAWAAAWDARAAAAAWEAATAAWDAARAAAWYAAWDAARAAGDAAWYAAGDAAWSAAGDAAWAKYSNWLVVRLESGY